ncbi:MAG: HipA family kinase [Armatimonadota bacterium]
MPETNHTERWWRENIRNGTAHIHPEPLPYALTVLSRLDTSTKPFLAKCSNGNEYWIKAFGHDTDPWHKRSLVTDQIAGRLGCAMGAPVARVGLIEITDAFLHPDVNPELNDLVTGVYHASENIKNCYDGQFHIEAETPAARSRVATLSLFYGLLVADDHQYLYESEPPHLVHSVDHGYFFPGGVSWNCQSLANCAFPALPDQRIMDECSFSRSELQFAGRGLRDVSDNSIAFAVSCPPPEWGISMDERVALAMFLSSRRKAMLRYLL